MFKNPFKDIKNVFGVILATILLGFYLGTWGVMIVDALTDGQWHLTPNSSGFFFIATTVSGIASALAIAILGITPPNSIPSVANFNAKARLEALTLEAAGTPQERRDWLTMVYLCAWVFIGVCAVIWGTMAEPTNYSSPEQAEHMGPIMEQLTNYGTIWFGMAMSAVFVYFKVDAG